MKATVLWAALAALAGGGVVAAVTDIQNPAGDSATSAPGRGTGFGGGPGMGRGQGCSQGNVSGQGRGRGPQTASNCSHAQGQSCGQVNGRNGQGRGCAKGNQGRGQEQGCSTAPETSVIGTIQRACQKCDPSAARISEPASARIAELTAEFHLAMASLIEAQAEDNPNDAVISELTARVEALRARLPSVGTSDDPLENGHGQGQGPGRGRGWHENALGAD